MKPDKYYSLPHRKFKLKYHLIFSTKYRKKCLSYIEEDLKESCERASKMQDTWNIDIIEIDKDHIHFLINTTPDVSISQIVKKLKQITTYDMWKKHHVYLKSIYWSGKHHLWTNGYFCTTIGDASIATIENYIKNQG